MEELELEFNLEDLEAVEKNGAKFPFPVAYLSSDHIVFNKLCMDSGVIPERIEWFCSVDYIIGLPGRGKNAFSLYHPNKGCGYSTRFPVVMKKDKNVKSGYCKIYKYKNGFAFKRTERLEVM